MIVDQIPEEFELTNSSINSLTRRRRLDSSGPGPISILRRLQFDWFRVGGLSLVNPFQCAGPDIWRGKVAQPGSVGSSPPNPRPPQ